MRRRRYAGALIAAAVLLVAAPAWSQEVAGMIKNTSGSVSVTRGGAPARLAQAGMQLLSGDSVATGPDSYAGITLRDDTLLTLGPDCRMNIDRFSFNPSTYVGNMIITVAKGALRVTTGLIGRHNPRAVQFRSLVASIGIRGTEFIVDVERSDPRLIAQQPVAFALAEPPAPERAPPVTKQPAAVSDDKLVMQTVQDWARAWMEQDAGAYLAFYAKDFTTPGNTSRSRWEQLRRARVSQPRKIEIRLSSLKVQITDPQNATATFLQDYRSSSYRDRTNKELTFIKENGVWRIKQERVVSRVSR